MRFIGVQLFLITALALLSGYPFPDFQGTNWDIVLFLTPSGILHNFSNDTVLKTFYSDTSSGNIQIPPLKLAFMGLVYLGMIFNVYFWLKRPKA